MTKEEFDNLMSSDIAIYRKSAEEWAQWGIKFEEHDMVLSTIAKRIAADYQQYADRIRAHRMNALVEKHHADFQELEQLDQQLQEIVKKAGTK